MILRVDCLITFLVDLPFRRVVDCWRGHVFFDNFIYFIFFFLLGHLMGRYVKYVHQDVFQLGDCNCLVAIIWGSFCMGFLLFWMQGGETGSNMAQWLWSFCLLRSHSRLFLRFRASICFWYVMKARHLRYAAPCLPPQLAHILLLMLFLQAIWE